MPYDGTKILNVIRALNSAESTHDLLRQFGCFIKGYGFTSLIVGQIEDSTDEDAVSFPSELEPYLGTLEPMSVTVDPIAARALHTTQPFRWSDVVARVSRQSALPRVYGDEDGYLFPVHSLYTPPGAVALGGDELLLRDYAINELELVVQTFYACLENAFGPFPYSVLNIPRGPKSNIVSMPSTSMAATDGCDASNKNADSSCSALTR